MSIFNSEQKTDLVKNSNPSSSLTKPTGRMSVARKGVKKTRRCGQEIIASDDGDVARNVRCLKAALPASPS